jgi:hypothetical protein
MFKRFDARAARISRTSHGAPQFLSGRGSSRTLRATIGTTSASSFASPRRIFRTFSDGADS